MAATRLDRHPSSVLWSDDLHAKVAAEKAKLTSKYRPRTRHFDGKEHKSSGRHADPVAPAGAKPNFTNRLLLEASPYLRQHAHNPVDWRPWGPAAFAEARKLGRPIFLSIGYATCHWCHVMEHESFEDLEIAALLNSRYVPIKVDREERPDVDAIYMAAVHALHGRGGWPMSVWIAPGKGGAGRELLGVPYFAGTYFPPRAGSRGSRQGFQGLLLELSDRHARSPDKVVAKGEIVARRIRANLSARHGGGTVGPQVVDRLVAQVAAGFDGVHGGRRGRPKFPSNTPYGMLLRHYLRTGNNPSLHMASHTLKQMARGGIYDHVAGGFSRYSTDTRWLVPHFEKMLYDQALIMRGLVEAHVASPDPELVRTISETALYVMRDMRHPGGAFYSATDADSEGEEGLYFLWTPAQLKTVLGDADGKLIASVYGVTPGGNFEGRSILNLSRSLESEARSRKQPLPAFTHRIRKALDKLDVVRRKRIPPLLDDKIITAWNGLMVGSLAHAGFYLGEPTWIGAAAEAASWLLDHMKSADGRLFRIARGSGKARIDGVLDDYAYFISGLLDLYEATGKARWLSAALSLQKTQDRYFLDARHGAYFATAQSAAPLLAREKPDYDGARPSGNSIAAMNLVRLGALTGDRAWTTRARMTITAFAGRLQRAPRAMSEALMAVEALGWPMREVVLVRPKGGDLGPMRRILRTTWQPHRVLITMEEGSAELAELAKLTPLVRAKVARGGKVTAYVCVEGSCKLPTTDPGVLKKQLLEPMDPR
ncbi:MAG: thioredoxin domain-containing protein [Myxococcales bacterium]|nr:thioredoxin domain-containing protein [Myxococcales bacterium]